MSFTVLSTGSPFGSAQVRTPKGEIITVPRNRAYRRNLFAQTPRLEKQMAREDFKQARRERDWHLRTLVAMRKRMQAKEESLE